MQDGDDPRNIFAAGEIMAGNILGKGYLAGFGMTIGTVFGRIAGREAARAANGAAEILGVAGEMRETLALAIAGRAREVALATISGKTTVEVAIVDRQGTFLACVGM